MMLGMILAGMIMMTEHCVASEFGIGDGEHGKRTASGIIFNTYTMTAAHRTRKFGSRVVVTHGHQKVTVTIVDRGPAKRLHKRCIDLSHKAARAINLDGLGTVIVEDAP